MHKDQTIQQQKEEITRLRQEQQNMKMAMTNSLQHLKEQHALEIKAKNKMIVIKHFPPKNKNLQVKRIFILPEASTAV